VSAVIGDISSDLTRYEALMTSSVQIPQCSFASVNTILSDEIKYPYFFRTISTTIVLLDAILDVIRAAGWNRISLIF
ncbi:MAG: periplasmic binding protein-like I, partial [Podila humilis]